MNGCVTSDPQGGSASPSSRGPSQSDFPGCHPCAVLGYWGFDLIGILCYADGAEQEEGEPPTQAPANHDHVGDVALSRLVTRTAERLYELVQV